jgi:hypothetical protein
MSIDTGDDPVKPARIKLAETLDTMGQKHAGSAKAGLTNDRGRARPRPVGD